MVGNIEADDRALGEAAVADLLAQYPPTSDLEENVSVQISFEVDTDGMARSVHVDRSSDPKWETEIVTAFREGWQAGDRVNLSRPVPGGALGLIG